MQRAQLTAGAQEAVLWRGVSADREMAHGSANSTTIK